MLKAEPVVYIIDDDENIRTSLTSLLEAVGRKVETFASGQEFVECCVPGRMGCVLLDVRMPGMSGLALQEKINKCGRCNLPIIFITGHGDVSTATEALKNGAVDFIEKPFSDQKLLDSIDKAIEISLESHCRNSQINEIKVKMDSLTPREYEIMGKIVDAKTNKMIALELDLSPKTVDFHRSHVMEKMGVNCAVQLTKEFLKVKVS